MDEFIKQLASSAPVPGGGGAGAVIGSIGAALCSMVANLTSGKKKYEAYQADIDVVLERTASSLQNLLALAEKDAEVFGPLSKAYGIPKDDPGRDEILEAALAAACAVPLEIMEEIESITDILSILSEKGTKLAVSDVGVAASAFRSAAESAALNVYINTKLMKNRDLAEKANKKAETILNKAVPACEKIYIQVKESLK
ncbi:MAG: cyclodeaminase/cyclohydrolase family protein [Oscillospiraceae bacterium]|nr:cyclodeaminase/cyclohydrolase family protein [Oscillospiraceae bacterium]